MAAPARETREVQDALERAARRIPVAARRKRAEYVGTALVVLGLPVPGQREIAAGAFSFSEKTPAELLAIWDRVYRQTPVFEARSVALLYYETRLKRLDPAACFPVLKKWAELVDNWEHSDRLSKIYAEFLERDPRRVYPVLARWNRSKQAWLRRQSVVSLLCYANLRKTVPARDRIFPLLERLVDDEDLYVQKGLGWTLRETGKVYPVETRLFVEKHVGVLRPTAFTIALEKASRSYRDGLKARRKEYREAR